MISLKRIIILVGILVTIVTIGTAGFMITEGDGLLESYFLTIALISTVGLGDAPDSDGGKILAIFLIASGVGTLFYAFGTFIEFLVGGYMADLLEERSMKKKISELSGHYIICGYGRVGEQVAREFGKAGTSFVVVDSNPESIARCKEQSLLHVEGDAADDEVLRHVGVTRAKGLVACVDSDADNVFVTLSARVVAPDLHIVARANSDESRGKLMKAGADKVVSPYAIGGKEMAAMMLRPMISDYLDVMTGGGELELRVEQFSMPVDSPAIGSSIKSLQIRKQTGAAILAVRKPGGHFETNPDPDTPLEKNDVLITVGTPQEIKSLEELFSAPVESPD